MIANSKNAIDKITKSEYKIHNLNNQFFNNIIEREKNIEAKKYLQQVKTIFDNGESYNYIDLLVTIGIPSEIAYSKNSQLITEKLGFTDNMAKHLFFTYGLDIAQREEINTGKLITEENAFDKIKVVLKDKEVLFSENLGSVYLFEEKSTQTNITYTGLRVTSGPLRMGNVSFSKNEVKSFIILDIGKVYVTNKRIIFLGKQHNKKIEITINSIIDYYLYKDAVLLSRNNGKNFLFKVSEFENYKESEDDYAFILSDFPIKFISLLRRIANKTY